MEAIYGFTGLPGSAPDAKISGLNLYCGKTVANQTIAIVPAAGFGSRMGNKQPKQFLQILGTPMLTRTLTLLHGRIAEQGGAIKLASVADVVGKVIDMTGLGTMLPIYPTVGDARQAFDGKDK